MPKLSAAALHSYQNDVKAIARKLSSNDAEREDLQQEMLIHLWQCLAKDNGHSRSFYLQSCRDAARNVLRLGKSIDSKRRDDVLLVSAEDTEFDALIEQALSCDKLETDVIENDALAQLMTQLPSKQQQVLSRLCSGFSLKEIAQLAGITTRAVQYQCTAMQDWQI